MHIYVIQEPVDTTEGEILSYIKTVTSLDALTEAINARTVELGISQALPDFHGAYEYDQDSGVHVMGDTVEYYNEEGRRVFVVDAVHLD